ncbi:MAG: hypothetical protein COW84_08870 [Gammaproteobacteria bacterium CG22_combo_CG10-13_8_21_14_all_40_8]|nr:MAG: hypothetical protein COW84_08870 [Gammaproteobacteria bacterium CG22_combo_CG10-13_8_21_14_all_40_8]
MKKKIIGICVALIFGATQTIASEAETTGFYVDLGYNWLMLDSIRDLNSADDLFYGLGYQFNDHWATEFHYSNPNSKSDFTPFPKRDIDYYNLNAVYRYNPRTASSFFGKMGLTRLRVNGTEQGANQILLGGGYEAMMTNKLSLVMGLDAAFNARDSLLDYIPSIGLRYFFNTSKPAPVVVAPTDSDNDGVTDDLDQCPTTAYGIQVDAKGCELDDDHDGVVNSLDQCLQSPHGSKVDAKGCPVIVEKEVSISVDVLFPNNSSIISSSYHDEIKKIADFMTLYPSTSAVITGYTDSSGSVDYNKMLSQKRANSVMQYLVTKFSIAQSRLSAVGKGPVDPIADNKTAEGRAKNRRVEAKLKTVTKKSL